MNPPHPNPDQSADEKGNVDWFIHEVHSHDASLRNYVRHSYPCVRDFEDVVQESYLRVWKRQLARPITRVTGPVKASVKGFLFQVARRLALDKIRRDKRSPIDVVENLSELSIVEERASVHESVSANQEYELLLKAIDRLPARCREVVVLRKLQGLSPDETARRLGISEETVHVQARKGLERVQSFLRKQGLIRNTVHDS
jgi:RNA polymerase sigma factor (sigma-70 family)